MTPKAEIISIGDELLYGQTLNTNAHWMSAELDKIGVRIMRVTTIGDEETAILSAFAEAETRADIILITGGLGPTDDDLTKPCLAKYFNCKLSINEEALQDIEQIFKKIGRELNDIERMQASLPDCCEKITNSRGTAPGMWFEKGQKVFISMPGVPGEVKYMMVESVIPRLQEEFQIDVICHKMIKTVGIGESYLSKNITPWAKSLPEHIRLAYLPSLGQVKLRLTATGDDLDQLEKEITQEVNKLIPYIENYIYGYDNEELEAIVGKMLRQQNKTIALAESCTGGYISHLMTSIAGSSAYFRGSVIPYHNDLKEQLLNVQHETLKAYGAVSEETVIEMAEGVRKKIGASIGIASSGIAGPTGGSAEKPVGTVWLACADGFNTRTKKLQLFKDRMMNIEYTGVAALDLARLTLLQSVEIN
jgi:nicotinamide-nucleotide amidase